MRGMFVFERELEVGNAHEHTKALLSGATH
jgi:hypothetical protein